jgi:hypothetical protein
LSQPGSSRRASYDSPIMKSEASTGLAWTFHVASVTTRWTLPSA